MDRRTFPLPRQVGQANGNGFKSVGILGHLVHQVVVLQAVHQMGGLNHQILDPVGDGTVQGLAHIVDDFAVPVLHMVDDDLAGEASSHGILREGLLHSRLDGANGQAAVVVVAGAKADHQQLVLADFIFVAGGVLAGVAGVAAEVLGAGFLALDELLLRVGQIAPAQELVSSPLHPYTKALLGSVPILGGCIPAFPDADPEYSGKLIESSPGHFVLTEV